MLGKSMVLLNNVYLVAYAEGGQCMLGDAMEVIGEPRQP